MALKTYAPLDVIDVKTNLRSGNADSVRKFWSVADAWTNGSGNSLQPMQLEAKAAVQVPEVSVVTFSDSALLFTGPEFKLEAFYEIAGSLKRVLESQVGKVYCIVSRGEEVSHHDLPSLGGKSVSSDLTPHYFNVAGTGDAWVNLHLADRAIAKQRAWHQQYTLYCVGRQSLPSHHAARDEVSFRKLDDNDELVLALA